MECLTTDEDETATSSRKAEALPLQKTNINKMLLHVNSPTQNTNEQTNKNKLEM